MATAKKFATLLLCLSVLVWGGPVAAISLLSHAVAANSLHYADTGSHSACGTAQAANSCCGDRHGCPGGACGGCAHACSAATLVRHAPFFLFATDTTRANAVSLAPINAFPPPLPPPRA